MARPEEMFRLPVNIHATENLLAFEERLVEFSTKFLQAKAVL